MPGNVLANSRDLLFDTGALIYYLGGVAPYASILGPIMERVQRADATLYLSVVTELETRVRPERDGATEVLVRIEDLLAEDGIYVVPLTRRLARQAAVIRARHRLSTTDAIIVATADEVGCDVIVGNDRQWRGRTTVPFQYLDDLIPSR